MNIPDEKLCYITTIGRVTGNPHEIEIWYAVAGDDQIFLMAGGRDRADWVKNLRERPELKVRINDQEFAGTATFIEGTDEDPRARESLAAKYQDWSPGKQLSDWAKHSLPVVVDLNGRADEHDLA